MGNGNLQALVVTVRQISPAPVGTRLFSLFPRDVVSLF